MLIILQSVARVLWIMEGALLSLLQSHHILFDALSYSPRHSLNPTILILI